VKIEKVSVQKRKKETKNKDKVERVLVKLLARK